MVFEKETCIWEKKKNMEHIKEKRPIITPTGYGVATVDRIDKIIGLFCKIASLL